MSSPSLREIENVFQSVVDLPATERDALLDKHCENNSQLRERVLSLLQEHDKGTVQILKGIDHGSSRDEIPLDGRIGPYLLLKVLGEGGCGMVFLARQESPIRREVALKVIKPGMDTRQVISRFDAERQTLAVMDHPNIARVLDAGVTDSGRPYFVMEYVTGTPINAYCSTHRLDINARLGLFIHVCAGVQHAHQKGIIHRDLKPSNVLVGTTDGRAIPKVIDFGISKAVEPDSNDAVHTEQGQLLGTPAYMSPEQASSSGQDIDTRSDVYSLGVLLYELLTGFHPFGNTLLDRSRLGELREWVLTRDPPKPSTRIAMTGENPDSAAAFRAPDCRSLARRLRGDLDWIILKAMEKDRQRRYGTVLELVNDIERHLHHEPVLARAPSRTYRTGKFIRRNRTTVMGGALLSLALIAGLIGTTIGLAKARRSELNAQHRAYKASIAAAYAGIQAADGAMTWRNLNAAQESLRGWEWLLLRRTAGDNSNPRRIPARALGACGASPNGRLIATSVGARIQVWDAEGTSLLMEVPFNNDVATQIGISADEKMMLVSGLKEATMYSLDTGRPLWTRSDGASLRAERLGVDASRILISTKPGAELLVINSFDGTVIKSYSVHGGSMGAPLMTRDGRHVIFSQVTGWIVAIDAQNGEELWRERGEWFHPYQDDEKLLTSETGAGFWTLRDMNSGRAESVIHTGSPLGTPMQGPDGRFGFSVEDRFTILDPLQKPVTTLLSSSSINLIIENPGSDKFLALCRNGELLEWDWNASPSPFRVSPFSAQAGGASIARGYPIVVTLGWGVVMGWDAQSGAQLWSTPLTRGNLHIAINHDASRVAALADNGKMFFLNGRSGQVEHAVDCTEISVTCLEWSNTGEILILGGSDGNLYDLRPAPSERPQRRWQLGEAAIHQLALHPSDQEVAVLLGRNQVKVIDRQSGQVLTEFVNRERADVSCIAYSSDGDSIYIARSGLGITRIDGRSGITQATYGTPSDELVALSVHPDGTRLAACSSDTVYVWNTATTEELLTLEGPHGARTLAFTSDGKTLLASGGDAALLAYETEAPFCEYRAREFAKRVRQLVDERPSSLVADDLVKLLNHDATLSPAEKAAATQLVKVRGDPPNTLNSRAWEIARDPRRSETEYRTALRYVDAALKTWPEEHSFLNTQAVLHYRLWEYPQALNILRAADATHKRLHGRSHPGDVAVMAMIYFQERDHDAAIAALDRSHELLADPQFAEDSDSERLLQEARELIKTRP